jgi:hypothetical protein
MYRDSVKAAMAGSFYKSFDRRYPRVKGYIPYASVAGRLAYMLESTDLAIRSGYPLSAVVDDTTWAAILASVSHLSLNSFFPVWWLRGKLAEALNLTDAPVEGFSLDLLSSPFGVVILPESLRIVNPDGDRVDFLYWDSIRSGESRPHVAIGGKKIRVPPFDGDRLHWGTILASGSSYASTVEVTSEGLIHGDFSFDLGNKFVGLNAEKTTEEEFILKIQNLLVGLFYYLSIRPDEAIDRSSSAPGIGFSRLPKRDRNRRRSPLFIGDRFQKEEKGKSLSLPAYGTHASPRMHIRRGHWRLMRVGEGRTRREWKWIRPAIVGG